MLLVQTSIFVLQAASPANIIFESKQEIQTEAQTPALG